MMKNNKWLILFNEKNLFFFITLLNLMPVFIGKFFPTMDGAIHLYNSNLINELLFGNNDIIKQYFIFNNEPVPNWTGHFILSLFNLFLPAFLAEKILILFYLIGLPYAFRGLIKAINPEGILISYFIFPFTYSFLFLLGFYNFSIALVFMMISLTYWIKNENGRFSAWKILTLFLVATITYFSHVFVFGILVFLIVMRVFVYLAVKLISAHSKSSFTIRETFRKLGLLLISIFIPLILFIYHFYSRAHGGEYVFINNDELVEWLAKIRHIIAYNSSREGLYTTILFYIISFLAVLSIYNRINNIQVDQDNSFKRKLLYSFKNIIRYSDFWIISAIIILVLYFVLPDSDGAAGFVSVRLGLLFFILLIVWISEQTYPRWLKLFFLIVFLVCNFQLTIYYTKTINYLNKIALDCEKAAEKIEPNSTVLPINYSDHWLVGNFYGYLGIEKPMILLENYEASVGYFPLKWNSEYLPKMLFGNKPQENFTCIYWRSNDQNVQNSIDYIFVLGDVNSKQDSCNVKIRKTIDIYYELTFQNKNCKLYHIKNSIQN